MRPRTPALAVDAIVSIRGKIVLVKRKNPPYGWAMPGGFVEIGETVEQAVVREVREETGLQLTGLRQFYVYSDPKRDPRGHTVTVVFTARGQGRLKAADDAQAVGRFDQTSLPARLAFDHRKILNDFFRAKAKVSRRQVPAQAIARMQRNGEATD